ncbi:SusC/RagA family TonB-linked outer membrane protein [Sphingobacterium siyangense]|uniref:TonB-linked SusC/RagA family outer membrane protein n=1 Tax=Sphingobacterium siyangense TaxID=459529 RepID=A0A562MB62_9SPHI|nr:TonB-dependent receptor [Sphingobacterium siyangense]TWI17187.1 TonB-linked SusC/RagA family outer membrane protein [Sphingobacterium siyangense]
MKRKLLLLAMFLGLQYAALAQNKKVSGKVIDALTQQVLSGVSITAEGARSGTSSDKNGLFSLEIPQTTSTIRASYIGYQEQNIPVTGQALLIALKSQQNELSEVVVVGYGTQKKKDVTGSISTIGSKDVGGRQTVQVSEALQGAVPGVSVTRSNGAPGAGSSILIRGITSLNNNSPLIIVDGVPVSNIDNINPNDVENISVLKDASSASIYGSRGAAGVILVTTKRGKNGKSSLDYTFEYGFQKATAMPEYVGIQDYFRYFNERSRNDGGTNIRTDEFIDTYLDNNAKDPDAFPNTNWQDVVFHKNYAPRKRHDLVLTSGTEKLKTKASFGYSNSDALYDNYNYERFLFRLNNDLQISSTLSANVDLAYKRTNIKTPTYNPIYDARIFPSFYDDYYADGRFAPGKEGLNPIANVLEGGTSAEKLNQLQGRVGLNYKPFKGLLLSALVSPTFDFDKSKTYNKQIKYYDKEDPARQIYVRGASTTLSESRTERYAINGQLLANYTTSIADDHHVDALLGYEENYDNTENLGAARDGFPLLGYPYLDAGSTQLWSNSGNAREAGLHSYFSRIQYNYKNKYYLQGNIRIDQSSRFAKKYRTATFPSFSGGWVLSEEKFMKGLNWINFLRFRGGWGRAGNERIGDYPYQANLTTTTALIYQNGVVVPVVGAGQQVYAIPDISWETTQSTDLGLDAALFSNKLNIAATYYRKKTFDILLPLDIPLYVGYDKPNQNAGTLAVNGWELEATWKSKIGQLGYSIAVNASDAKSKIGDLKGTQTLGDQLIREGSEYNEWFGYRYDGIFQSIDEVTAGPVANASTKPGDFRYVDTNGDGKITPDDKVTLGGALPRYQYGGNIRLDYKGFDFALVFQGVGKKLTRRTSESIQPFLSAFGNVPIEMVGKFWSTNNTEEQNLAAFYPRLSNNSNPQNYALSDHWLMNGSYFRLKNLTLGYTLTQNFISKAGIQSLRIFASANDLFSLSHFPKYIDPEAGNFSYPIVTTYMFGASVSF